MGAFQSGFQMGQRAWQQALDNKDREARRAQEAEAHGLAMRTGRLQAEALENAAAQQRELAGLRTELGDYQQGFNRQGFNTAANNDFDAALAASDNAVMAENAARALAAGKPIRSSKGVDLPTTAPAYATPVQSNLDATQGMRTQFTQAPDVTSDGFQRGMSGLQQRYALAAGDMKGFGDLQAAERVRRTNAEDAAYSMKVIQNPEGPEAIEARSFVNNSSRSLSVDTDPKTGISTFRIIKGDRTKPIDVGPSDMGKIAVGVRRLQRGDVGGLDVIAAVNKDLAAAVREEFKLDVEVGKSNNDANYKLGSLKNQTEGLRLQQQRLASDLRANRQLDPADVKRLNDMAVAIQGETDPVKRQKLMQDYRVAQAGAMSKIGRVVGLPEPKVALDIPYDKFMEIYGDQKVEKVKGEMVKLRDLPPEKGRAYYMQFRNGADGLGGLPDVAPPPRNPAAPAPAPAAAPVPEVPSQARTVAPATRYDMLGRPIPVTQGLDLTGAVRGVDTALNNAAATYLRGKIERNEPLSPAEAVRASRMGLLSAN